MKFIHFSNAERIAKSTSLITVTVHVSKVLSPAIFNILPLKLTSIGVILDAGSAAALPASNVAPIEVPFRGRVLKIAGDRTFDTWSITVLNDTDFAIRSAFEKWMNTINRVSDNTGTTDPADYQADAYVYQLDRSGDTLRKYHFYDVFPSQVAPIELSYDAAGIQEFTVELQVQWWEAVRGTGDNSGGEDIN